MARTPKPWYRKDRKVWCVTIDGVRHNLGRTKKEAFDLFYKMMSAPKRTQRIPSRSLAIVIDDFLEWVSRNRSPETYRWYRDLLQSFIENYPDLRADQLRPYHVENWAATRDISITTRRNYLRSVKRCMKWAKKQGYIDVNPIEDLEVPAGEAKEVVVSHEEYKTLLDHVCNPALRDLLVITWETGCRPQESLCVEARHVDLANQRWVFRKSESKMRKATRIVYLTDNALAITKRLMLRYPTGPIFRNRNGKPWTTDAVNCGLASVRHRIGKKLLGDLKETISNEAIEKLIKSLKPTRIVRGETVKKTKAELRCEAKRKLTFKRALALTPKYSLYALRHSWATYALQRGVDPLTVAILMGHKDPSTLTKVYQHLSLNPAHMLDQAKRATG